MSYDRLVFLFVTLAILVLLGDYIYRQISLGIACINNNTTACYLLKQDKY